jgi:hypothetical protein
MDVIINEVVSTVRLVDNQSLLDERTLGSIVRAVVAAMEEKTAREGRREGEAKIDDDGRGGITGRGL